MSSEQIHAGQTLEAIVHAPIELEHLKKYAEASGDYNPIHTNEDAARKVGLPGIIAHGMLSAGFLADRANRFIQGIHANWRISAFQTRFKAMTFLGDVISVSGVVKFCDGESLRIDLVATNGKGEVTSQGYAEYTRKI